MGARRKPAGKGKPATKGRKRATKRGMTPAQESAAAEQRLREEMMSLHWNAVSMGANLYQHMVVASAMSGDKPDADKMAAAAYNMGMAWVLRVKAATDTVRAWQPTSTQQTRH